MNVGLVKEGTRLYRRINWGVKRFIQQNNNVAKNNFRFNMEKYLNIRNRPKLFELIETLIDYILLIFYIINRILQIKTERILRDDYEFLYKFCQKNKIKKILEFGPGDSTYCFLRIKDAKISTYEYNEKWLKIAQKKFNNLQNVRVSKFENEENIEINCKETFDLCFVDSPLGKPSMSRLNTCLCGIKYTNLIIMHDSKRKGEKQTIKYLENHGWKPTYINTVKGLCILRNK